MAPWLQITLALTPCVVAFLGALLGTWLGQKLSRDANQQRWKLDQKLKIYSDILRAINEYSIWIADTSEESKFAAQAAREWTDTLSKPNKQIAEEFHAAYAVASIFLRDETVKQIEKARPVFFYHSDALRPLTPDDLDKAFNTLLDAKEEITKMARTDLHP